MCGYTCLLIKHEIGLLLYMWLILPWISSKRWRIIWNRVRGVHWKVALSNLQNWLHANNFSCYKHKLSTGQRQATSTSQFKFWNELCCKWEMLYKFILFVCNLTNLNKNWWLEVFILSECVPETTYYIQKSWNWIISILLANYNDFFVYKMFKYSEYLKMKEIYTSLVV